MSYGFLIDVTLVLLFSACVYLCARSGFIKTIALLLAAVVALGLSYFISVRVSPYISRAVVEPFMEKSLSSAIESNVESDALGAVDTMIDTLDRMLAKIREKLSPDTVESSDGDTDSGEEGSPAARMTNMLGGAITTALLFFIFYALILAILRVFIDHLSFIRRIPIIGPVNTALGFALGAFIGIVLAALPIWIYYKAVSPMLGGMDLLESDTFAKSRVVSFIASLFN